MKLSELIDYKNTLESLSTDLARRQLATDLGEIKYHVENQKIQLGNFKEQIDLDYQQVHASLDQYDQTVAKLLAELNVLIESSAKPWFLESYRLYEEEMCHETNEYILNRRPTLNSQDLALLNARLQNYADWRFPGMIIRPGQENFVEHMVSFDPLFLIDQHYDLLKPAMQRYPEDYQRRVRPYVIKESLDHPILGKIPDNQFGICFIYNFFEFRPLEIIKKYLNEIYTKLRPGGVCIFTFNDCDRGKAVQLVEQHFCCYTPGSLIRELTHAIGYEQVFSWHNDGPSTWLEIRKPGTLDSLRGGQTLAKIIHK